MATGAQHSNPADRTKGIIALILLSLIFASMGIFVRYLQFDFTILQQTYLRILAAFLLGTVLFWRNLHFSKLLHLSAKDWALLILRSCSLYLIGVTLLSAAFTQARYSNVAFVGALPMTAVFGFILLREKVTWQKVGLVALGFIGVVLVAVKDYSHLLQWGHGEVLALIASIFFSISYVSRKFQSSALNNQEIAVVMFGMSTILLLATSTLLFRQGVPAIHHANDIVLILLGGLFNVANLFLTNYGFQKIDAVLGSNLLMLETVFAVMLGLASFGEVPSLRALLGGSLIVLSAYLMNQLESRQK